MGNQASIASKTVVQKSTASDSTTKELEDVKLRDNNTTFEFELDGAAMTIPEDWIEDYDDRPQRQRAYYYNPTTHETSWTKPQKQHQQHQHATTKRFLANPKRQHLAPHEDWEVALDRSTGRIFLYHPATQQARWKFGTLRIEYNKEQRLCGVLECTPLETLQGLRRRLATEWDDDMLPSCDSDSNSTSNSNSNNYYFVQNDGKDNVRVRITQRQEEDPHVLQELVRTKAILTIEERPNATALTATSKRSLEASQQNETKKKSTRTASEEEWNGVTTDHALQRLPPRPPKHPSSSPSNQQQHPSPRSSPRPPPPPPPRGSTTTTSTTAPMPEMPDF
jgi:hypothetical protein